MSDALPWTVYAHGFSLRKRRYLRRFVAPSTVRFVRSVSSVPAGACLLLWGDRIAPGSMAPGVAVVRVEDGFLRSVGLGAELVRPLSWVFDRRGMYYDATCPSDLEVLLQHGQFDARLLARAALMRRRIVATGLTKYNIGGGQWRRPPAAHVVLVAGQVEGDASLARGAPGSATNMALLQAVRERHPKAYLVYKPHPDVAAGLRAGAVDTARYSDEVVSDVAIDSLLGEVDEVHVMTSLTGFEALLRGCRVVCHGQPFYAGWGLTEDLLAPARRTRVLTLDQLVAAALILYPVYVNRHDGSRTTPEQALDELLAWRARRHARGWGSVLRWGLRHWAKAA